jgi:hypothetical protein
MQMASELKDRNKRNLLKLVVGLLVVTLGFLLVTNGRVATASKPVAISMAEAYRIAKPKALEWSPNARLYQLNSADTLENTESQQGLDGTRNVWYIEFAIPDTERHFVVRVSDRTIEKTEQFRNPTLWPGYDELPPINMGKVLATVKAKGLQPGTFTAFGYHYRLLYVDEIRGVEFWVYGQTANGKRSMLKFDPKTSDLLH